ncbi:MAG: hypothetical protein GY953_11570 [bacterium]|nr:hypothetical protein [bacterium]
MNAQQSLRLFEWERGIGFESPEQSQMRVYLWFYEWNMFEARKPGEHTGGSWEWTKSVSDDGRTATTGPDDLRLKVVATTDSADLSLEITNRSSHDWPELAAVIPCFNPGPEESRNQQFANTNTYFYGPRGLERLQKREIHFADPLRPLLDRMSPDGTFFFSHKWPTSPVNAAGGVIIRESGDGEWVTGIAWEDFLSAQGHNPWQCMHLSVRVGPLKPGERKTLRGKVYLFRGDKEDCLRRYLADFGRASGNP